MRICSRLLATIGTIAAPSLLVLGVLSSSSAAGVARTQETRTAIEDLSFFTLFHGPDLGGPPCINTVSVLHHQTGEVASSPRYSRASLASLRASPYLQTVVAGIGFDFWRQTFSDTYGLAPSRISASTEDEPPFGAIYIMQRQEGGADSWDIASTVIGPMLYYGVEILPDNETLIIATAVRLRGQVSAPYAIEAYGLSDIVPIPDGPARPGSHRFGPRRGQLLLPDAPIAMKANMEGDRVYVLTRAVYTAAEYAGPRRMALHTIDPIRMVEVAAPIMLDDWIGAIGEYVVPHMAIHPDGDLLVTTAGVQPIINVVYLQSGKAKSVTIEDAGAVSDIAFSYGPENYGMLAAVIKKTTTRAERLQWPSASGKAQVRVGTLSNNSLVVHGVSAWSPGTDVFWPAAVDWESGGLGLVAALEHVRGDPRGRQVQAAYMSVPKGGGSIEILRELSPCDFPTWVMDILTANGHIPTATPTTTARPSETQTATPPLPSDTPTAPPMSSTVTPSASPTKQPQVAPHVYLPFSGRWYCFARQMRQDVVLVLDTSSSMADRTRLGRRKIDAARDAALDYLDLLQLDAGDRASVITFDAIARVVEPLTDQREVLRSALSEATLGSQTCIPCAIEAAAEELTLLRRRPGNTPVIVLLTDGRSNPRPISEAVALADRAKGTGIVFYTIGLGDDLESSALAAMASQPAYFFHAPDAEDLIDIYRGIAVTQPCPNG